MPGTSENRCRVLVADNANVDNLEQHPLKAIQFVVSSIYITKLMIRACRNWTSDWPTLLTECNELSFGPISSYLS